MAKILSLILCMLITSTVHGDVKVLGLSGSSRKNSYNHQLVKEATDIARQKGATITVVDLNDYPMPFYDADLEASQGMPPKAKELRRLIMQNDVIIIGSPEYNGSLSGLLKNVIDWLTRSEEGQPSRDAFKDKKFIIMSASPGPGGGSRGLVHLRAIIEGIGGTVLPGEVTVPNSHQAFDENGRLKNPEHREALHKLIDKGLAN